MDDNLISISGVVGHRMIFMYQAKKQDVSYSLGVILDRIGISGDFANFVGVCCSCVTMDTYEFSVGSIYDI